LHYLCHHPGTGRVAKRNPAVVRMFYSTWSRRPLLWAGGLLLAAGLAGAGWWVMSGKAGASGRRPPAMAVVTAPATVGPASETIEAVGTALASQSITVTAKNAGTVAKVLFQEGQKVAAGTLLVELDSREIAADLQAARAQRESARLALERARALLKGNNASQAKVDELEAAAKAADGKAKALEARMADTKIDAPFAGVVGIRRVDEGAQVTPATVITTLDDTETMRLAFSVPERALQAISAGSKVNAQAAAYPGRAFEGEVTAVDSRIDPVSRAIELRARVPNPDGALKPGMFLSIAMELSSNPQAIWVPEAALIPDAARQILYKVADGKAKRVEVKIGVRRPGFVEIREGVKPGEEIVVEGQQRLRDGQEVKASKPPAA